MSEESVTYQSIGRVHSPFPTADDVPKCESQTVSASGTIELVDEYEEGLTHIDGFSHIVVLTHLHEVDDVTMRCDPPFANVHPGIFATRGPRRPNPIGLSIVRLSDREGSTLHVDDLDLIDGTPVLDIKPFAPKPEEIRNIDGGWITEATDQDISRE